MHTLEKTIESLQGENKLLQEKVEGLLQAAEIGSELCRIVHDFNNVLMGISGHASLGLLKAKPGTDDYRNYSTIERLVETGAELARDILSLGRGSEFEALPHNLNPLIQKEVGIYRRLWKDIEFRTHYASRPWKASVSPTRFKRVLQNLLVNSRQAMPDGGTIEVSTLNTYADAECCLRSRYVSVTITDNGHGMDEETAKKAFDERYTTRKTGNGLGLPTVKSIVECYGGNVDMRSVPHQGTTFTLSFPVTEEIEQKVLISTPSARNYAGSVLLYEPMEASRVAEKMLLESFGFKVYASGSVDEAFRQIVGNGQFTMLVCDLHNPDDFCRIYASHRTPKPAILMTSSGLHLQEFAERYGASILEKPFSRTDLQQAIMQLNDNIRYTSRQTL